MISALQLCKNFEEGEFATLLIRAFGGVKGDGGPFPNMDFVVTFDDEDQIPSFKAVSMTIVHHYRGLGYHVEVTDDTDRFGAFVSYGHSSRCECRVFVTISPYHPIGKEARQGLQVTCEFVS